MRKIKLCSLHSDHPSPPEGPLKVTDIHKEGCMLGWNPPADDGGAEISHYVVEKQDMNTGHWTTVRL